MSDQTIMFDPYTWVWCKIFNKMWWPAKVVDFNKTPKPFQDEVKLKKKNTIAIVLFVSEKSHLQVTSINQIVLYNCPNRMNYIEKGYVLHNKQIKGQKIFGNFNMTYFINDVILAEKSLGNKGDINVFTKLEMKYANQMKDEKEAKELIKKLFVTEKEKKRNSLQLPETSNFQLDKSEPKKKQLQLPREQSTNLKRHMAVKKMNSEKKKPNKKSNKSPKFTASARSKSNKTQSQTPKPNNANNKKSEAKKGTLKEKLLKDCDEDETVVSLENGSVIDTSPMTSPSSAEVEKDDPTEHGNQICFLDGIPTPDWVKESSITGLDEAVRKFATIDIESDMMLTEDDIETCIDTSLPPFEPMFFHEIAPVLPSRKYKLCKLERTKNSNQKFYTDEELLNLPAIKKAFQLLASGQGDKVQVSFTDILRVRKD